MGVESLESQVVRVLVAVAPPTPNGDLHLGHLSGPYLATDVYSRYLKSRGLATFFVTGTDDHQSYVPMKGKKLGVSPAAVVEKFGASIPNTLETAGMRLDYFLRPYHTPKYQRFVQEFFQRLVEKGALEKRRGLALYCDSCRLYLYEAHVGGKCPKCGDGANGNGCEKCGFVNDCVDLVEPRCNHCQSMPGAREYERFYFPLNQYASYLKSYFQNVSMNGHLHALTERMLCDGYPDLSASHVADWGIPVGLPGYEGQVIYEWLEMAAGYLYLAEELTGSWESFFKDPKSMWVLGYGFDNAFFYTSFIPALLHAFDSEIQPPRAFLSNEFYLLQNLKFSTSRNHAVWGDEFLGKHTAEELRFYLSLTRPESEQTNFDPEACEATLQEKYQGVLVGWVDDLYRKEKGSKEMPDHAAFVERVEEIGRLIDNAYQARTFSLRNATRLLLQLAEEARDYGRKWEFVAGNQRTAGEREAARVFSHASYPLLPALSVRTGELP